jgi:hypothetical protein
LEGCGAGDQPKTGAEAAAGKAAVREWGGAGVSWFWNRVMGGRRWLKRLWEWLLGAWRGGGSQVSKVPQSAA